MTPQELKNSILQLAIQGKLVEQRPEEGTAQELYAQIQAEKQRLIQSGKLKKEKPLPEITEDEKPFEIPEGWMWVRVGDIFAHNTGKAMNGSAKKIDKAGSIRKFITTSNVYWNSFDLSTVKEMFFSDDELERCTVSKGDLLMCEGGAYYGRTAIWTYDYDICFQNHVHRLRPYGIQELLFFYHLFYFYKTNNMMKAKGTAMPGLSSQSLHQMSVPLPPLAEQKRIVSKIEELLPLIDRYEQAWTKLEDFNRRFHEDMKKSILQQAIQGKLVEQRPEEGTAQELYAQIQAEKQRLIKEGKIKKEKPLPEITEDEKPFEIPEGWMWVRLGTLTEAITSGSRDWAKYYSKTGDIFLRMGNLSKNSFDLRLDKIQRVTIPESTEGKRTSLQAGDLLFSITGDVGMLGLIPPDFGVAYINQHTAMLRFMEKERNRYIPYLLLTDYAQKFYNGNQHGIKNSFRLDSIAWLPVPLPPLAEQKRIVGRLEELLAMYERLK